MSNEWMDSLFSAPTTQGGVAAVDAYGKNVAAGMAQGATATGRLGTGGMASYMTDYQPYDKKFMAHVDNLGTDSYRAQQRGQAMTDVGIQMGNAQQAVNRNMARMGVNPNSAAFASTQGQLALQGALGKVQAGMAADRGARDEWVKGVGAINAMGNKVNENSLRAMTVAGDLGKTGMMGADLGASSADRQTQAGASATSAGASALNASTGMTNAATQARQVDNSYQLGLGRLALDRYNIDTNSANLAKSNSLGNVFGSTAAGYLTKYGADALASYMKTLGNSGPTAPIYSQSDGSFSVVPPGSFSAPTVDPYDSFYVN